MKLNYSLAKEVTPNGKKLGTIHYRPNTAIYFTLCFGVFLLLMFRNTVGLITGALVAGLAVFYLVKVKDHPVIDVYEKELIVYDENDLSRTAVLACQEITEYYIAKENSNVISLRLKDGEVVTVNSAQKGKAQILLGKALPKKASDDKNLKDRRKFFTK